MEFDTNWDIEKYNYHYELPLHWELKRKFITSHKSRFPENRLICLAQIFCNVHLLGCRYSDDTMELIDELSQGLIGANEKFGSRRFPLASDAVEAKVEECENDCAGVVQLLLDLKADVDALDKHGYTPLCVAATSGNTKVIDVLHRNGANINHVAYNDDTAIYLSARKGNKEIVRKLAALGARPTVKNFEDIAEWGSTQLLDILKSADVDFTIRDSDNISILHLAALTANTPVVAWLLNNSSLDIDTEDFIGSTALHYAISTGSLPLVRTLVKHGANVNAKDIFDATPLYFAFYWKRLNVAKYLLSKGAKI